MLGCGCPMPEEGRARGVWPTGRGRRIGVVVGSVVIGLLLLLVSLAVYAVGAAKAAREMRTAEPDGNFSHRSPLCARASKVAQRTCTRSDNALPASRTLLPHGTFVPV